MLLRTSLLEAVRHPALWRRIDISSNRPRHPAYTKAEKDQQEGLCTLAALDHQYKEEYNRPGDGKASTVDPIVSISIHLMSRSFRSSPCAGKNPDERALTTGKEPIKYHVLSVYLTIKKMMRIPLLVSELTAQWFAPGTLLVIFKAKKMLTALISCVDFSNLW